MLIVKIFVHKEFGDIRTLNINNKPWFVGEDVATALGYSNSQEAIRDHVDEDDRIVYSRSDTQDIVIINEFGLCSLISSSELESAKIFKRWVKTKVLPRLEKN